MKKLLILFLLLIAAFVGLVMAAPLILDSEKLKADFTGSLEEATGHQAFLDGDFTISVFPKPAFVANKIRVLNSEKGTKENLLTIESIEADLDLTSFLFGQTKITDAVLHKPEIFVEVLPNGDLNWLLDVLRLSDISRQEVYHDISIPFSKIDIVDGTLNFTDKASGIERTYSGFDGEFTAKSKKGPFRFEGNMDFLGKRSNLAVWLEKTEEDTATPFNVMISSDELSSTMNISGNLLLESKGFEAKGSISVESSNPANLLKNLFPNVNIPNSFSTAAATNMSLLFNNKQLLLRDMVIKQGNASAVGNIDILLQKTEEDEKRYTSKFMIDNFAIDGLIELTNNILKSPEQKGFTLPLDSYTEVTTGTLKYANHDIKDMKFIIDADNTSYKIQKASASLIADTSVKMDLTVTKKENEDLASLSGKFAFETENMNEIAAWLDIPLISKVRKNSLFAVKMSSDISGSGYNFNFNDMTLKTGNVTIKGRLGFLLTKPKNLDFDIKINDLDLDKYLPQKAPATAFALNGTVTSADKEDKKNSSFLQELESYIYAASNNLSEYKDFDIKAKMDIGKFTYNRDQIGHIVLSAAVKNSKLTLEDFTLASRLGGTVAARGIFDFTNKDIPSFEKFNYNARLVRCSSYLDKLGLDDIFNTSRLSNIKLEGQLNGAVNNLSFVFAADSAGLSVANEGKISMKANESPLIRFHTDIRQPQLRGFMSLLKDEYNVPLQINKNLAFSGLVTVKDKNIVIKDIELSVGSDSIRGNFGSVSKDGHNIVNLQLETGELDITEYVNMLVPHNEDSGWSDSLFPFTNWLKEKELKISLGANNIFWQEYAFQNPIVQIKADKGAGRLQFMSELEEGKINLSSDFDFSLSVPAVLITSSATNIKVSKLLPYASKMNISADKGSFTLKAKAQGRSMLDMVKSLAMEGNIKFTDGKIKGFSLDRVVDFMERIKDDRYYNPSDFSISFEGIFQNNATSYDSLEGSFAARSGIIKAPEIKINYRGAMTAKANFNYSIPDSKISTLIIVPPLTELGFYSGYQVIVKGETSKPAYNYRIQGLIKDVEDSVRYAATGIKPAPKTETKTEPEKVSSDKEAAQEEATEAEDKTSPDTEEKKDVPLIVPMDEVPSEEQPKAEEPKPENKNITALQEKIESLDSVFQTTEKYVFEAEKITESVKSLANIYAEMKKVLSDMKYSLASVNAIISNGNPSDEDMKTAQEAEQNIRKKADLIAKAYDKLLLVSSIRMTEEKASAINDFVVLADEMEKSNPYLTNLKEYTKIVHDADYEVKMALQKVKTKDISSAEAGKASDNAKSAYAKAKAAVDKIMQMVGYSGS
jgi:uncharacterized protein involved in outer membrane biogenesis